MKPATLKELLKPPIYLSGGEKKVVLASIERWEMEHGEPLRWLKRDGYWKCRCPKCLNDAMDFYNFCPSCGERLLPPDEWRPE